MPPSRVSKLCIEETDQTMPGIESCIDDATNFVDCTEGTTGIVLPPSYTDVMNRSARKSGTVL